MILILLLVYRHTRSRSAERSMVMLMVGGRRWITDLGLVCSDEAVDPVCRSGGRAEG